MTFKFKINLAEYAKRFGIKLPDDSSDVLFDDSGKEVSSEDSACSCCDVATEDATVSYAPNFAPGSLAGQCQATLQQCKAKNPMTCRYHGAKVIADDIEAMLKASGITAPVDVKLLNTHGNTLTCTATVQGSAADEQNIAAAMKNFFALPGVDGDIEDIGPAKGGFESPFEIDMLDPKAKAKWGNGTTPLPSNQPSVQQTQSSGTEKKTETESVATPKKPRPTRKRAKKDPAQPEQTENVEVKQPEVDMSEIDVSLDDDSPELYPDQRPPKPPEWKSPFDAKELDTLAHYAERIGKTSERLDGVLAKEDANPGELAKYLAKGNGKQGEPNANLPRGLQQWKNKVDVANLRALAEKDTDGQVKAMLAVAEKIDASEANGWKDKIGVAASDVKFDPSKYADPYAKERAAYEAYVPVDKGRDSGVSTADSVLSAKDKNAPKEAADAVKAAHQEMKDLEEGFKTLADSPKAVLKTLAQAYHKANEKFKDGVAKCKKWYDGLSVMKSSIRETIDAMKERGETIPEEMLGWEAVEATVEDQAWRTIAATHGLNVADKEKHMAIFKKNMRAMFQKCTCVSGYNINHVIAQMLNSPDHTLHANTNSYVNASNAAFGTSWARHSAAANNGMHTYAKVFSRPFAKMNMGSMYSAGGNDVGMVFNPKKAIISYVHQYMSSVYAVQGHPYGSNATFVNDATCSGVAMNAGSVNREAFTTDLSDLPMSKIQSAMGLGSNSGEAWAVGGLKASQCLAVRECANRNGNSSSWNRYFTQSEIDKFNAMGITVLDKDGNVLGKNCVPDDPDLQALVFGKQKKK